MWARVLHEHVGVRGQLLRVVFFPPHGSWGWTAGCQACSSALTRWVISSAPGNCSHGYNSAVCAISLMKNNTNPLRVCNSSTTFDNKEIDKSMQNKLGKVLQTYRIPAPGMYSHEDQKFKASLGTQCCGTLLSLTANKHYSDWLTKSCLTNS